MDRRAFLGHGLVATAGGLIAGLPRPRPAAAATRLFGDSFRRPATSKGWGGRWYNQRYGLPWGIKDRKGFFDLPAPATGAADYNPHPVCVLDGDVLDVDVRVTFSSKNENSRVGLTARSVGYSDSYAAYVDRGNLVLARLHVNHRMALASAPVSIAASTRYRLRFEVSGVAPVTLRAKLWRADRTEPLRWTVVASHSDPSHVIDTAGAFGLLFMHDAVTQRAARVRVSKFLAYSPQAKAVTKPRVTFSFAGRTQRRSDGSLATRLVAKSDVPAAITFQFSADPRFRRFTSVPPDTVHRKPRVAKAWLEDVTPGTTVYWRAVARTKSGGVARGKIRALTVPAAAAPVAFAFGSCTSYYTPARSYNEIVKHSPSFFAHLGDFGYAQSDHMGAAALRTDCFQDRWTRMLDRGSVEELHRKAAWLMIQDDHDYGRDGAWSQTVRPFTVGAFDQISGNLNERYFDLRYGDAHCFVLDTRLYADDPFAPDGPRHSMLGGAQKAWLKDAMRASDAPLLVVMNSLQFWGASTGDRTWKEAFETERVELMTFFGRLQTPGRRVVICSGNAHGHFVNHHPDPGGGRDIVELVSSGTDRMDPAGARPIPGDGVIDPQRAVKDETGFGFVALDGPGATRSVTLRAIHTRTGADIWPPLVLTL